MKDLIHNISLMLLKMQKWKEENSKILEDQRCMGNHLTLPRCYVSLLWTYPPPPPPPPLYLVYPIIGPGQLKSQTIPTNKLYLFISWFQSHSCQCLPLPTLCCAWEICHDSRRSRKCQRQVAPSSGIKITSLYMWGIGGGVEEEVF